MRCSERRSRATVRYPLRHVVDHFGAHAKAVNDYGRQGAAVARTLQWRDYDRVIRLRAEHSKNRVPRVLPVEAEIATVIERRLKARRLDTPYIFHRNGRRIGDFRKLWAKACQQAGVAGRIVHDLRRSGVKHLINAGVDPHTVMAFQRAHAAVDAPTLPHHRRR